MKLFIIDNFVKILDFLGQMRRDLSGLRANFFNRSAKSSSRKNKRKTTYIIIIRGVRYLISQFIKVGRGGI